VLEESDADRMLAELVRVTRPGGRAAAIVRAVDMLAWVIVPLSADILAKAEHQRGMANGGLAATGCGDRGLYRRMRAAGLTGLTCLPQFAVLSPEETARLTIAKQRILASLTAAEAREWQDAAARAEPFSSPPPITASWVSNRLRAIIFGTGMHKPRPDNEAPAPDMWTAATPTPWANQADVRQGTEMARSRQHHYWAKDGAKTSRRLSDTARVESSIAS
jgi:hypothetical protein